MHRRTAIEADSGVVRLTVLCAGCADELLARLRRERPGIRLWARDCEGPGAHCEFCVAEAAAEAL